MLEVSLSEILVVAVVALFALGPKEMLRVMRSLGTFYANVLSYRDELMKKIKKEIGDDFVDIIVDGSGEYQKVYDLEKIKPYIGSKDDDK